MIARAPVLPAGCRGAARSRNRVRISTVPGPHARNPPGRTRSLYPRLCSSAELPEPASGVTLKATGGPQVSPRRKVFQTQIGVESARGQLSHNLKNSGSRSPWPSNLRWSGKNPGVHQWENGQTSAGMFKKEYHSGTENKIKL